MLREALIKQTNKGVTDGLGDYRKGNIVIKGAKLKPHSHTKGLTIHGYKRRLRKHG